MSEAATNHDTPWEYVERCNYSEDLLRYELRARLTRVTVGCACATCARCGATEGVELESSRTMYPKSESCRSPNADILLCRSCAKDHHDYWDERWDEYRAGLL